MEFNELMQSFAAEIGLPSISVQNDMSALEIGETTVAFFHDDSAQTLIVAADLGIQSINADGPFASMMLKANHLFEATKGATLFQNPENDAYGLQQMYAIDRLDAETLAKEVKKIVELAEQWKAVLGGSVHAEAAAHKMQREEEESTRYEMSHSEIIHV